MAHKDNEDSTDKPLPPYLSATTFLTTVESWRAVRPSRIDRSVLMKVPGSVQTWMIAALKYFGLIDDGGVPTPKLDVLATASEADRPKLLADMIRAGYPFLFTKGVDLSNITHSDLKQKFEDTGAKGETAVKAMSFFTAMAKAANITISPYVTTRQRRSTNGRKGTKKPNPAPATTPAAPAAHTVSAVTAVTPMQVLIDMLDVTDMKPEEQAAVWTLIRYLKKAGS